MLQKASISLAFSSIFLRGCYENLITRPLFQHSQQQLRSQNQFVTRFHSSSSSSSLCCCNKSTVCKKAFFATKTDNGKYSNTTHFPDFESSDPCRILGIVRDSKGSVNKDEVRQAYLFLVKIHHPDIKGGDDTIFRKLKDAHDFLLDANSEQQTFKSAAQAESEIRRNKAYEEYVRESNRPPPPRRGRRVRHGSHSVLYGQLTNAYILHLSQGLKTPETLKMFDNWFELYNLMNLLESVYAEAAGGGSDRLFFCDDEEKAFWASKVEEVTSKWEEAHSQFKDWSANVFHNMPAMQNAISIEDTLTGSAEFKARYDTNEMAEAAKDKFEDLKLDLMMKRSKVDDDLY